MDTKRTKNWNPDKGDACQGDVLLFKLPDAVTIKTDDEIAPAARGLILAEGEITGHHHIIGLPKPVMFRDDGLARTPATAVASSYGRPGAKFREGVRT